MCEICGISPRHPRCPNSGDTLIGVCAQCHTEIYGCDKVWGVWEDADGNLFCERDCALEYYGIKEIDD